ncbi:MAG: lipopolysaccharide heptosyltransferase II [Lentisphaeria bacterium]
MDYHPILKNFNHAITPCIPKDWHHGLLIRGTNWLGDCLMTLPAAWQLRHLIPKECSISVLTPSFLAPIWKACTWIDHVIPMRDKHISSEEIKQVQALDCGIGIVFPNSFGSALDIWKCSIPIRIGRSGNFRSVLLNHRIPKWKHSKESDSCHQLSYYLELISTLGSISLNAQYPPLQVSPNAAKKNNILKKQNVLAIAPGAAFGPAKQWPTKNYIEVAKYHQKRGGKIVIVGTAKEQAAAKAVQIAIPEALDLTGKTNLSELMSILANTDTVIANDSGAMHLAAALGTPGVAIFGSTDPIATGPLGAPWKLLIADTPCRPCFQRICPLQGDKQYHCLHSITPKQVIAEWEKI